MTTKGKRYTEDEKQKVVSFVKQYNAENNGRGGVANASKHFGITAMTVKAWMVRDSSSLFGGSSNVFQKLGALHETITVKEVELNELREQFSSLKEQANL